MRDSTNNVLIIGGSSTIGIAIQNEFEENGHTVVSTHHSRKMKSKSKSLFLDLSCNSSIEEFCEELGNLELRYTTVIFLASVLPGRNLQEYVISDFDRVMAINFTGQSKILRSIFPFLEKRSSILMMSSISGRRGSYDPIYAASKGAVIAFVKSLSKQLPKGMRINALAPGLVKNSKMYFEMNEERRKFHASDTPTGDLVSISDLAKVVVQLSGKHWSNLNGTCVDLNGGSYV